MKTADLSTGQAYATTERLSATPRPGLLLDRALWQEKDEWGNWDGASARTSARIVRKAPKDARVGTNSNWRRGFWRNGLPVLVMQATAWDFSESARDTQIVESAQDLLVRAQDAMGVMDLVSEGHDGRVTATIRRKIVLRTKTVKGAARKIEFGLEFLRPQQITGGWTLHAEQDERERAAKAAIAKTLAESKARSTDQAQGFTNRLSALLGDDKPRNIQNERYDFHRKWTSTGTSSTYEVSAEIIEQLLALAEKGMTER